MQNPNKESQVSKKQITQVSTKRYKRNQFFQVVHIFLQRISSSLQDFSVLIQGVYHVTLENHNEANHLY